MDTQNLRYEKMNGLRAYAAIGIILMHVQANLNIELQGFLFAEMIPSFTNLVFLFMIISSFSICCGYFEKIKTGQFSVGTFYRKRVSKIWPFFALLCLAEFAVTPSLASFYEVLANLTLCFGLIPNHGIEVIGVGWFLGLVFVFYMLFPFFCYLLSEKKRAWFSFGITLLLNFLCENYFGVGRTSIAYSAVFFMLGGLMYLYRVQLQRFAEKFGILVLLAIIGLSVLCFTGKVNVPIMLVLYGLMVTFALRSSLRRIDLLNNPLTKWLSGISMEMYLSHMLVFRALEMFVLEKLQGFSAHRTYVIMTLMTIAGTILFSFAGQKMLLHFSGLIKAKKNVQ